MASQISSTLERVLKNTVAKMVSFMSDVIAQQIEYMETGTAARGDAFYLAAYLRFLRYPVQELDAMMDKALALARLV